MTGLKDRLLNIILFPARFFNSIGDNKVTLCIGVIFTGLFYLLTPDIVYTYEMLFPKSLSAGSLSFNILVAAGEVLFIGIVYTVFFSVPLYDFFKYLKKKEDKPHNASLIKMMKIFIITQLVVLTVNTLMFLAFFHGITENSGALIKNLYVVYYFLLLMWFSGNVTRGINKLFDFNPIFKRLTFITVFTWIFVLVTIFDFQIMNWLLMLFKQS